MQAQKRQNELISRSEFMGIAIITIFIGGILAYINLYFTAVCCFIFAAVLIREGIHVKNKIASEKLPILVFKSPEHAFEYICEYISFDYDMAPGLVVSTNKIDNYTELVIKYFHEGKVIEINNNLNLLKDKIKVGDLIVSYLILNKMVVEFLMVPKFNPNTVAWKVLDNAGRIKVNEIPIRHLHKQRSKFSSFTKLEFKTPQEAFAYVREYMTYDPNQCLGLVKYKIGTSHDGITSFMINIADEKNYKIGEIAFQHPELSCNIKVGDLVYVVVDGNRAALAEVGLDKVADRYCIIRAKLEPVIFFNSKAIKTIRELADYYLKMFERKKVSESDDEFWLIKGSWVSQPSELKKLVEKVEFDIIPDNYKYKFVVESLTAISEDNHHIYDNDPTLYSDLNKLMKWLTSHKLRQAYVDMVLQGDSNSSKFDKSLLLLRAQWIEKKEVFQSVIESLQEIKLNTHYHLSEVPLFYPPEHY